MYIEKNVCLGCGSCKRSCPTSVIRISDEGKAEMYKPQRCIRCFHCAAACPVKAVHIDGERDYQPERKDVLEKIITSRRSVRHYTDIVPEREILLNALDTAMYAPSGKNIHENKWSVLYGKDRVQEAMHLALDWAESSGIYPELPRNAARGIDLITCGAPCVIIGHSDPKTLNPMADTVIAMATAELLLVNSGLSTCWGGYLRHAINSCPELKAYCGIADNREAYAILMVGHADKERYLNIPPRSPADIHWID